MVTNDTERYLRDKIDEVLTRLTNFQVEHVEMHSKMGDRLAALETGKVPWIAVKVSGAVAFLFGVVGAVFAWFVQR